MNGRAPSDAELRGALEGALARAGLGRPAAIRRRPSAYRTSFPLERLELTLADGAELRLAFKRLDWEGLDGTARLAKPRFLHDPRREQLVYVSLLGPAGITAPRCYGAVVDPGAARHWLFLEWVDGRELFQVGELTAWQAVARWLGEMHSALAPRLDRDAARLPLLDYDEAHYRRWVERALEFGREAGRRERAALGWLARRYGAVVDDLLELPKTIVHGELYASNVLVAGDSAMPRVAPVDWELAAAAPGLIDLAALISGGWDEPRREAIVAAYRAAPGVAPFSAAELDLARLHLAVQWLGWAPRAWVPPPEQRHDWLGEAIALAEGLGL